MVDQELEPASFLLLLPPALSPPEHHALKELYGDTLSQVLKEVAIASEDSKDAAILEIALACPHLITCQDQTRSSLFATTQEILSGVYKLICVIATKEQINIETSEGVDVRILLVAWTPDEPSLPRKTTIGPVIDLPCLAASKRPWQYAFGVEGEQGEAFVRAFVAAKSSSAGVHSHHTGRPELKPVSSNDKELGRRHLHAAVGGTFDHIHVGHKLLLTMAFFAVDQDMEGQQETSLVVGTIGADLLKNKKFAEELESWDVRQKSVYRFAKGILDFTPPDQPGHSLEEINEEGPNGHRVNIRFTSGLTIKCVELSDPCGPTITQQDISLLIISGETRSGGKVINDKRGEQGWEPLDVVEVAVLDPVEGQENHEEENFASKLSSTEIRRKLSEKRSHMV